MSLKNHWNRVLLNSGRVLIRGIAVRSIVRSRASFCFLLLFSVLRPWPARDVPPLIETPGSVSILQRSTIFVSHSFAKAGTEFGATGLTAVAGALVTVRPAPDGVLFVESFGCPSFIAVALSTRHAQTPLTTSRPSFAKHWRKWSIRLIPLLVLIIFISFVIINS